MGADLRKLWRCSTLNRYVEEQERAPLERGARPIRGFGKPPNFASVNRHYKRGSGFSSVQYCSV